MTALYLENITSMVRLKKLFVSCNGQKKNRVGRSVKKNFWIIFLVKNVCFMHV